MFDLGFVTPHWYGLFFALGFVAGYYLTKYIVNREGVKLEFSDDAISRMSFMAYDVNSKVENIGARRLHTIMETLLEDISFTADEHSGETITIDSKYVDEKSNGRTYLIFETDEINLSSWTSTKTNENSKRIEITMSDGIKSTITKLDLTVDNTAPKIMFSSPAQDTINSGEITV